VAALQEWNKLAFIRQSNGRLLSKPEGHSCTSARVPAARSRTTARRGCTGAAKACSNGAGVSIEGY
jgi:hypothetical protein